MNPEKSATARRVRRAASNPTGLPRRTKPGKPPPPPDPNDEVSALVEALHANVQRLEELTAGEVDTVADRQGRPFLLRRAQEQLRDIEAAKQSAILNALPAHIALLDSQGSIISVNDAWRRFAGENVLQATAQGIGLNYLAICDIARGDDSAGADQVAQGIRSVLSGGVEHFSIEYPCHSPTEQRWFLMTVTPMAKDRPGGAVVMHLNMTQKKHAEEALLRFGAAMDSVADAIYVVDRSSMAFVHVNDAACRMQNKTRAELHALGPAGLLSVSRTELESTYDAIIASGEDAAPLEMLRERQDGAQAWIEVRRHARRVGERWAIVTLVRDITERKQAADAIRRSAKHLRGLIDGLGPSMFVGLLTPDGVLLEVNLPPLVAAGLQAEDVLGKRFEDTHWWSNSPQAREQLRAAIARAAQGEASRYDVRTRGVGNQIIDIDFSLQPLRDESGKIEFLVPSASVITERNAAQEALRASAQEQRQLAEQLEIEQSRLVAAQRVAKVGSWEMDLTTLSVIWSEETHRIQETDPATYRPTHRSFVDLVHPEDRARFNDAFSRSLGQRAVLQTLEHRLLLPDGRIKFVEERWRVLSDEQQKPVRVVGTCQDITERKKIEDEIHETRNFLSSIFDNIPNSIFVKDALDLRFIRVNTASETLTGYSAKELLGKNDYDLFPREQADFFVAKDRETLAGKQQVFIVEETITSRDGTRKLLQTKKFPILDKDGHPQYLLGMSEDITERKQAERRLRESEAKFRHLIEQADDGMFTSDPQGNFVLVNSRGCELLGYTEQEMLGMNGSLTYPEEDREIHASRLHAVDAGQTLRFERLVQRKDGSTFPAEISIKKLDNGMVQVIFRDITARRGQEKKISRLSRIQAVLSGINAAIVRIRDRQELFREACRIIVEHGHFILGWIAVLNHETGKLTAVAHSGLYDKSSAGSDFFNGSVGLVPAGSAAVALRDKNAAIDNAIENAPGIILPHEPDTSSVRQVAIALGAKSVIVLPLIVAGKTFGILTLYAPEKDFFDDEEVKLLNDLAGDISFGLEFINKEEEVDYLAYYDALTGLANRRLFLERLAQFMRGALTGGHKLALFFIDLERFRNINDSLGRSAGDALLKQVSDWLSANVGDPNLLARLGGDHFAIVLPEIKREGNVATLVEKRIRAFLDHSFRLNETEFRIPIKVGVAFFPDDGSDADTLLQNAEAALKNAKYSGERYLFFTQRMTATVAGKLTLENQLRQAVDNEEFVLHYQPKVSLESGKLTGAEALIRWNDPRTGQVPPARFIPILEESGLIYEVGRWALRKAIEDYLRWRAAGLPAVRIAVNVSPLQLRGRGFIEEIGQVIGVDAKAAAGLELEITESLIMEDITHSIASLQAIRALGVTIAIDDFGTGFSSLSYLARLPVDTLKIDRSFVTGMTAGSEGLALVSTIISLAHALKLNVVAEGVETEEQSRLLRLLNCEELQGYLFSKPLPGEIFESRFLALPFLAGEKVNAPRQVR